MTAVQVRTGGWAAGGEGCAPGNLTSAVLLAGHLLELQLDTELQPYGLTTRQYRALQFIQRNPDCTRSDLAQALHVTRQAAGGLSHRMVASRMLERVDAPVGYSVSYYVTTFGERMLYQAAFVVAEVERGLMDGLSVTPPGSLVGVMEELIEQMNDPVCAGKGCGPANHGCVQPFSRGQRGP